MYTMSDIDDFSRSPSPPPPPAPKKMKLAQACPASPAASPSGATLTETSDANCSSSTCTTRVQRLDSKGELVIVEQGTRSTHSESLLEKGMYRLTMHLKCYFLYEFNDVYI